ncbi:MAG: hypothetical protein WA885_05065 [Phormidesmis sp.]
MFIKPSVLPVALAATVVSSLYQDCKLCQPETIYRPTLPVPEMTVAPEPTIEIALRPNQEPFPYSLPVWSEQLPSSFEWSRLLPIPESPATPFKPPVIVDVHPPESQLSTGTVLVAHTKEFTQKSNASQQPVAERPAYPPKQQSSLIL